MPRLENSIASIATLSSGNSSAFKRVYIKLSKLLFPVYLTFIHITYKCCNISRQVSNTASTFNCLINGLLCYFFLHFFIPFGLFPSRMIIHSFAHSSTLWKDISIFFCKLIESVVIILRKFPFFQWLKLSFTLIFFVSFIEHSLKHVI